MHSAASSNCHAAQVMLQTQLKLCKLWEQSSCAHWASVGAFTSCKRTCHRIQCDIQLFFKTELLFVVSSFFSKFSPNRSTIWVSISGNRGPVPLKLFWSMRPVFAQRFWQVEGSLLGAAWRFKVQIGSRSWFLCRRHSGRALIRRSSYPMFWSPESNKAFGVQTSSENLPHCANSNRFATSPVPASTGLASEAFSKLQSHVNIPWLWQGSLRGSNKDQTCSRKWHQKGS